MARARMSSRFSIVIPKEIRESMRLKPGDEFEVMEIDGVIEIVRMRPIKDLRGRLKGINVSGLRDDD